MDLRAEHSFVISKLLPARSCTFYWCAWKMTDEDFEGLFRVEPGFNRRVCTKARTFAALASVSCKTSRRRKTESQSKSSRLILRTPLSRDEAAVHTPRHPLQTFQKSGSRRYQRLGLHLSSTLTQLQKKEFHVQCHCQCICGPESSLVAARVCPARRENNKQTLPSYMYIYIQIPNQKKLQPFPLLQQPRPVIGIHDTRTKVSAIVIYDYITTRILSVHPHPQLRLSRDIWRWRENVT